MKEELAKEILAIVNKSKEGVVKGFELVKKQCPELLKEIITLLRLEAAVPVVCHFIISTICFVVFSKLSFDLTNIWLMIGNFGSFIAGIVFLVFGFTSLVDCIKPFVAPRLTVIDYVSKWIKK